MLPSPPTDRPPGSGPRAALLALAASLLLVGSLHLLGAASRQPQDDALRYLALAWNVAEHGVFAEAAPDALPPEPQARYMPLYPVLVGLLMRLDGELRADVECALRHERDPVRSASECRHRYESLVAVQAILLGVGYWLVWLLALDVTRSPTVAWAALGSLALCEWPLEFVSQALLEVPLIALFALLSLAVARAARGGRPGWYLLAGACAAALILIKAVYLYAVAGLVLLWLALSPLLEPAADRAATRRGLAVAAIAALLTLSPWLARNAALTGKPVLSEGYGASILVQRISYNAMTPLEWVAAFVYWFPDVGDSIADRLFEPSTVERLRYVGERSFYVVGNGSLNQSTAAEARSRGVSQMRLIAEEHVLGDLPRYLAVTAPLLWRGVFVSKWWGVLALGCLLAVLPAVLRSRRLDLYLVFAAPLGVLLLHALVSVSFPRYNLVMVPMLALSIGMVAERLIGGLRRRRTGASAEAGA